MPAPGRRPPRPAVDRTRRRRGAVGGGGTAVTATPANTTGASVAVLTAAALELADERGFPVGQVVTAAAAAEAAGVGRSTVYRSWPTTLRLNDDLVRFGLIHHVGWQRRLLAADPSVAVGETVASLLAEPRREIGLLFRCLAPQLDPSYRVRQDGPSWEARWSEEMTAWVRAHLHATGRRVRDGLDEGVVALAVTATIEGTLIDEFGRSGPDFTTWTPDRAASLGATVEAVIDGAGTPADTGGPAPDGPDLTRLDDPDLGVDRGLLRDVFYGILRHQTATGRPVPTVRLVDPDVLAERVGVSVRRVYQAWDTASACNADLVEAILRRDRTGLEAAARTSIAAMVERPDRAAEDFRRLITTSVVVLDRVARRSLFDTIFEMRDPVVLARSAAVHAEWTPTALTLVLAAVHASGRRLAPGAPIGPLATYLPAASVGAARLHASRVLARSAAVSGRRAGAAVSLVADALLGTD